MTDPVHPHWQSTDGDEQPVAIRIVQNPSAPAVKNRQSIRWASRKPAALVGIALFLFAGWTFHFGFGNLFGQVSNQDFILQISDTGVEPSTIEVPPGGTILIKNNSSIPHIIQSDSFLDGSTETLETNAIFPQEEYSLVLPLDAAPGTYTYISKTSPSITGEIRILAGGTSSNPSSVASSLVPTSPSSSSLPSSSSVASIASEPSSSSSSFSSATSSASTAPLAGITSAGTIPSNPHTVANANVVPMDISSSSLHGGAPARSSAPAVTTHPPLSQPQTGTNLWVSALLVAVSFLVVLKKATNA